MGIPRLSHLVMQQYLNRGIIVVVGHEKKFPSQEYKYDQMTRMQAYALPSKQSFGEDMSQVTSN
jgi:hypothetical protein